MANDTKLTRADHVAAAVAAVRDAQGELAHLTGKLATLANAHNPVASHDAHTTARDLLAHVQKIVDSTRQLVIEAQAEEAAAEEMFATLAT